MATKSTPGLVPAVFAAREQVEAVIPRLKELGLEEKDIGVVVLNPGRYRRLDESLQEHSEEGARLGAGTLIGTVAGIGLVGVTVPPTGLVGLGGLALGLVVGAVWGSIIGSLDGLVARIRWHVDDDRWCDVPLGADDILIVTDAGLRAVEVQRIMQEHGARCLIDPATLEAAWRELDQDGSLATGQGAAAARQPADWS